MFRSLVVCTDLEGDSRVAAGHEELVLPGALVRDAQDFRPGI